MNVPLPRIVAAARPIAADADVIFEFIADPARQPLWDGNDNLAEAPSGQRVRGVGDVFTMTLTRGTVRHNHVVEFEEGRLIAWRPSEPGGEPPGHLWRWSLQPVGGGMTLVTHTYDWTQLTDPSRLPRARATTADMLDASLERLAALVEQPSEQSRTTTPSKRQATPRSGDTKAVRTSKPKVQRDADRSGSEGG